MNVTDFVHIGDLVKLVGFEKNPLKCDNWDYVELIEKNLTGVIEEINYGTNIAEGRTKTEVILELDDQTDKIIKCET